MVVHSLAYRAFLELLSYTAKGVVSGTSGYRTEPNLVRCF